MITSATRYRVMIKAARQATQPLLDAAATLLPQEPEALVKQPDVSRWLDEAYRTLPLSEQGVERIELAHYLKDRLRVYVAAEAARGGAHHATVIALLWPPDRRPDPRSAVASSADAAALWPALKDFLQRSLTNPPWDCIVEIFSSDCAEVAAIQPDPREFRSYFRSLRSMGYDKLDDRFRDSMECGALVEPGWVEANIVPQLPPAGAFAYVASFHADRERLLALVEHVSDGVAFAAIARLAEAASPVEKFHGFARELRATIALGRGGNLSDVDNLAGSVTALRADDAAFHERLFAALARHPARLAHRLTTFADDAIHHAPATAALRSIAPGQLETLVRAQLLRATSRAEWRPIRALAEAIEPTNSALHAELLSAHETSWRNDPDSDTTHLPLIRAGLLFDAFRVTAANNAASFRASTSAAVAALLRRLQGRFLGLDIRLIDEVLARIFALGNLSTSRHVESTGADFLAALDGLRKLVARWRGMPCEFLDFVTMHLLGAIDPTDEPEVEAGVTLLRAAAENEVLSHTWASWVPEEPGLRAVLLPRAHTTFIHSSAPFLANTTRNAKGEGSLFKLLLETSCADCETITLRRLVEFRGAMAPLARAILDDDTSLVERELRKVLALRSLSWVGADCGALFSK